jgi:hypothetical protein
MLTLLRVRREARLRRRPELGGASCPLQRAGSLQPSFFQVIRNFKNDAVKEFARRRRSLQPSNYESGGQEFESLRARHLSGCYIYIFYEGLKFTQTKKRV